MSKSIPPNDVAKALKAHRGPVKATTRTRRPNGSPRMVVVTAAVKPDTWASAYMAAQLANMTLSAWIRTRLEYAVQIEKAGYDVFLGEDGRYQCAVKASVQEFLEPGIRAGLPPLADLLGWIEGEDNGVYFVGPAGCEESALALIRKQAEQPQDESEDEEVDLMTIEPSDPSYARFNGLLAQAIGVQAQAEAARLRREVSQFQLRTSEPIEFNGSKYVGPGTAQGPHPGPIGTYSKEKK